MQTNKMRCVLSITALLSISPIYGSLWDVIQLVNNHYNYANMQNALANFQDTYPDENKLLHKCAPLLNDKTPKRATPLAHLEAPDTTKSNKMGNEADTSNHVDTCLRKQYAILANPGSYTSSDIAEVNKTCNGENLHSWFEDQKNNRENIAMSLKALYSDPDHQRRIAYYRNGALREKLQQNKETAEKENKEKEEKRGELEKRIGGLVAALATRHVYSPQFMEDGIYPTQSQFLRRFSGWGNALYKLSLGSFDVYNIYRNMR